VAVLELVPVLDAVLDDDAVPVWDGVFDWEAEVDPVVVLMIDGATDEAATDAGSVDALTEATTLEPATDALTEEAFATTDEPLTEAAKVLGFTLEALTLAAMVPLKVSVREKVLLVHWNLIILLLLKSETNKKYPGKSGS